VHGVGFLLVAAMIGMFAGSALSIVVVPSLASHQVGRSTLSNRSPRCWCQFRHCKPA
jgi:hypothetical protein